MYTHQLVLLVCFFVFVCTEPQPPPLQQSISQPTVVPRPEPSVQPPKEQPLPPPVPVPEEIGPEESTPQEPTPQEPTPQESTSQEPTPQEPIQPQEPERFCYWYTGEDIKCSLEEDQAIRKMYDDTISANSGNADISVTIPCSYRLGLILCKPCGPGKDKKTCAKFCQSINYRCRGDNHYIFPENVTTNDISDDCDPSGPNIGDDSKTSDDCFNGTQTINNKTNLLLLLLLLIVTCLMFS